MQIAPSLPEIVDLVRTHPVVSVIAPTGSGKSVGIPAAITTVGARCFVSVPTRTAAQSLAQYQRTLQPDLIVGHAAEGQVEYDETTQIAYVTGGHLRRKMLSYFSGGQAHPIDFCQVLMVDEVHSGTLDTTVIISLWMYAAASQVQVPRLIIASATPVPMEITPPPVVYEVQIPQHPVSIHYLEQTFDFARPPQSQHSVVAQYVASLHEDKALDIGHFLIFAAGASDVQGIAAELNNLLPEDTEERSALIIPAFGALRTEDIQLLYAEAQPGVRKIIVATNIAEMSITIQDLGIVIDTMLEKRAETSLSGGFRLTTTLISKDSATQRCGRTGRTGPGECHRMMTKSQYSRLDQHRPAEVERVPIHDTLMELLDVGLTPENILRGINSHRVAVAVHLLNQLGMVESVTGGVTVTDKGHFAPHFPLSVRNAAFLWDWITEGYPIFPGIVTAALIDSYGPSYFWFPRKEQSENTQEYKLRLTEYKAENFADLQGDNDLASALNMWSSLTTTLSGIEGTVNQIVQWSNQHSMNAKKIRELLSIVQQCVKAASRLGYDVQLGPFTTEGVITAARPLLRKVYQDQIFEQRGSTYVNVRNREVYKLDLREQISTNPEPAGLIALVTAEIQGQKGTLKLISFSVDTDIDSTGRQLGSRIVRRGPPITRSPNQQITAALNLLSELK